MPRRGSGGCSGAVPDPGVTVSSASPSDASAIEKGRWDVPCTGKA